MGQVECVTSGWRGLLGQLDGSDILFIAPSAQKARAVRKSLPDLLSSVCPVTLDRVINEIVDSAMPGVRRIGRTATEYVVASILKDRREDLGYLPDVQTFPGTATAVARFISATVNAVPEVVHSGFREAINPANPTKRDRDLILVGDEFLNCLRSRRVACADMLWILGLEALRSGECSRVQKLSQQRVVIDGVYSFTELHWRVLAALAERAEHTYVLGHALADHLTGITTIEGIRTRLPHIRVENELVEAVGGRAVRVFGTRDAEVQAVAQQILEVLGAESGLHACDIAVVTQNPDRYLPIIEECFSAYGVPFEAVDGFPLRTNPMACVAQRLLTQIQSPGDRAGLFELLASGSVDADGIDIHLIDRFARRFNISDLSGLAHELDSMPDNYLSEGEDLERLHESMKSLDNLLECLRSLARQARPQEFVDRFLALMVNLEVVTEGILAPRSLLRSLNSHDAWMISEWSRRNSSALGSLVEVLEDIRDTIMLFGEQGRVSTDDLIRAIEDAVGNRRYRCEPTIDAVRVMSVREARGVEFEHCFVLGLVEGEFPAPQQRGFLQERQSEWRERRWEAAHHLLDILDSTENVHLTAFASDNSNVVGISPVLARLKQVHVAGPDGLSDDSVQGCARSYAQTEAGLAFSSGKLDRFLTLLEPGDVSQAVEQLKMEVSREIQPSRGPYGGEVTPGIFDLESRYYSVSQLETYIRCPFQYMTRYLLGIKPMEEVEDELVSNEMGSFIHQILCEFGNEGGFSLMRSDPKAARDLLLRIAQTVFSVTAGGKRLSLFMKVQFERLVDGLDGTGQGNGLLRRFFDYELSRATGSKPREFEKKFEFLVPETQVQGCTAQGRAIRIVGLIDRVDVSDDGSVCLVVDYKTGRPPSTLRIVEGLSLQLPVYLMALVNGDSAATKRKMVAGYYYLPAAGSVKISSLFGDTDAIPIVDGRKPSRWDRSLSDIGGLEGVTEHIRRICSDMGSGTYVTTRLSTEQAGCRYCDYSGVCRHEQVSEADLRLELQGGEVLE